MTTIEHVAGDAEPWRVRGWSDAAPIATQVQSGRLAWETTTIEVPRYLAFRTRELAERAAATSFAEAATLYHAQFRLHSDPLEPHDFCIRWKIGQSIPLTPAEDRFLAEAALATWEARARQESSSARRAEFRARAAHYRTRLAEDIK